MRKPILLTVFAFLLFFVSDLKAQCWQSIAAGYDFTTAIRSDGTLWAWGKNWYGQLGVGNTINSNYPLQIGGANNWAKIASGAEHSLAIKLDGTLWAWGRNVNGKLGDGTLVDKYIPVQIGVSTNWVSISAGNASSLAIKSDGSLWAWGNNLHGELGDGTNTRKLIPTRIGTDTDWKLICCNGGRTIAIKLNGTLWAWGENFLGQLGDGTFTNKNIPTQITSATNWNLISAGELHSLATKNDGTLWAWGSNSSGQLGDGTFTNKNYPIQVGTDNDWAKIGGGGDHSMGIKTNGYSYTWGDNSYGESGDGTLINKNTPTQIITLGNSVSISTGVLHSVLIKQNNTLWGWGRNFYGQLGDSTNIDKNYPVQINSLNCTGPACFLSNPPTGEALTATNYLCSNNIILHTQDGNYNAVKSLRRKDLAKITFRSLFINPIDTTENAVASDSFPNPFSDLQIKNSGNSYYFSAAKALSYLDHGDGITPFNRDRINFYPEDSIARGYALKVFMEAWNIQPDSTLSNPFNDVSPGEMKGYILKAANLGLINTSNPGFRPYDKITREEAFIILYRIINSQSKPTINYASFYKPFNISHTVGAGGLGIDKGNFNSYSENCFNIKGVPSLQFSFSYNASSTETPDEFYSAKDIAGNLLYDQQPLGVGWNHNYNAYIIVDYGLDDIASDDNRFLIFLPGSGMQVYNPFTHKYISLGIYDSLKIDTYRPATDIPTQITITTKNQVKYTFQMFAGISAQNILNLVSVTDRNNNTISLSYETGYTGSINMIKRLKTVSDPYGRNFDFQYTTNTNYINRVVSTASAITRTVAFYYSGNDLAGYIDPIADTTSYSYFIQAGVQHLLKQIKLPKGNLITNGYYQRKLISSQLNSNYNTTVNTTSSFNNANPTIQTNITTTRNGQSLSQNIISNANTGMPISISAPAQKDSLIYGDALNPVRPTKHIDQLTNIENTPVYDNRGNLLSVTKHGGSINITESFSYNNYNDLTAKTDGNGNTTSYSYNAQGNLVTVAAPFGTTNIIPNSNGTVQSITNPSGIVATFNYDSYGNILNTNMPLGISSSQVNDAAGKITSLTNPNNHSISFQYNLNDNKIQETVDPAGLNQTTNFQFDKNSNLTGVQNALGNSTYLTYNQNDELTKEQLGPNFKQFSYNDDGTLQNLVSPNNVTFTQTYNSDGRVINDGYATYTYNTDKTIATITKDSKTLSYSYDALERVTGCAYSDFATNLVNYTYDNNNNLKSIRYPTGVLINYDYDANNRLIVVKDVSGVPFVTYSYLPDGRLSSALFKNQTVTSYSYDAAGRLDSISNAVTGTPAPWKNIADYKFILDNNGNHVSEKSYAALEYEAPSNAYIKNYSYDVQNRLISYTDSTTTIPVYDNNGNNLTDGSKIINYDIKDNIVSYANGNTTHQYEYDGLTQRRKKDNIRYVLDMNQNVLMETDLAGNPLYYYVQGLGLICRIKASNNSESYYYYDYRGSTVAIVGTPSTVPDTVGLKVNITHRYSYGPFGELGQLVEADFNPFRYVGKYGVQFEDSCVYFMRARYYNSKLGRFLGEDPIWNENLYPYCENNPIINTDISGLYDSKVTGYDPDAGFTIAFSDQIIDDITSTIKDNPIDKSIEKFAPVIGEVKGIIDNINTTSDYIKLVLTPANIDQATNEAKVEGTPDEYLYEKAVIIAFTNANSHWDRINQIQIEINNSKDKNKISKLLNAQSKHYAEIVKDRAIIKYYKTGYQKLYGKK